MKRFRINPLWSVAVLGALLVPVVPAAGQNALGDGRKLDRNLRVGSGGTNPKQQPSNYGRYQDAIITGNVGGLSRFRGRIDYGAVGEFHGRTAADDTFGFRRQSLAPYPVTRYQERQLGTGPGRARNPLIYPEARGGGILIRSGSGVFAGQVTNQVQRYPGISGVYRDDTLGAPRGAERDGGIEPSLDVGPIQPPVEQTLGYTEEADGRLREVTASPLMGLRTRLLERLDRVEQTSPVDPRRPGAAEETDEPGAIGEETAEAADDRERGLAAERRIDRRVAPTLLLGQRLDERVQAEGPGDRRGGGAGPDRVGGAFSTEELRRRVLGPPPDELTAKPGQDVYQDVLRRIRGRGGADGARPGEGPGQGLPEDRLTAPQDETDKGREDALDRIEKQFAEQADGEGQPGRAGEPGGSVRELIRKLDYDLPPLRSFVGQEARSAFSRAMREAEQSMSSGLYFEASALYRRAMLLRPYDPLAQIGRANAQLGAGLFMSASRTLRGVLAQHPELVKLRYEPPLMPPEERLKQLQGQLEVMAENTEWSDPALLLGYLGYQRGEDQVIRKAMELMKEQGRRDPLYPVLRRLWLEGNAAGGSGGNSGASGGSGSGGADGSEGPGSPEGSPSPDSSSPDPSPLQPSAPPSSLPEPSRPRGSDPSTGGGDSADQ